MDIVNLLGGAHPCLVSCGSVTVTEYCHMMSSRLDSDQTCAECKVWSSLDRVTQSYITYISVFPIPIPVSENAFDTTKNAGLI